MTEEWMQAAVPALHLMLGDLNPKDLHTVLAAAFGDRLLVLTPSNQAALESALTFAKHYIIEAQSKVTSPPLGTLACQQVAEDIDYIHQHIKAAAKLANPTR